MNADIRINKTIENFGHPDNTLTDMGEWVVLLRPKQVTLGSLVLVAAHPATSFGELPPGHFATLGPTITHIENRLRSVFKCDKFNYLMLMMVDPHVHFHVIPRYATAPTFLGQSYPDPFWPKPPDVTQALDMSAETFKTLHDALKNSLA